MNILDFEQSVQEPRGTINEVLSGLKRKVRDAYDRDLQRELDRKVAWGQELQGQDLRGRLNAEQAGGQAPWRSQDFFCVGAKVGGPQPSWRHIAPPQICVCFYDDFDTYCC